MQEEFIKDLMTLADVADSMARENYTDTQVWTIREWKEIEENRRYLA